jgi:hypothetical protein
MNQLFAQQQKTTITEDFDNLPVTFIPLPATAWQTNTDYSVSPPNSYRGKMPHQMRDSVILETSTYDFENYSFVLLRFSHICKVSPLDTVRIEYRVNMGVMMGEWESIPRNAYMGSATNYNPSANFNSASYAAWQSTDSTVFPTQSWWREEMFDLGYLLQGYKVQFRFVIKRGNVFGTQISYGWLIDNFEIIAANYQTHSPVVGFVSPLVEGTKYGVGPYVINAKVATRTSAPIKRPKLQYSATNNGIPVDADSILMDNVSGDSLWRATIKSFPLGTDIVYSIHGEDTLGNYANAVSGYEIRRDLTEDTLYFSIAMVSIDVPDTVATGVSHLRPVIVTVKNKGGVDLTSATISYSLNGEPAIDYHWTPSTPLPWDYTSQSTIGSYTPKLEGYDTLEVWVTLPNGKTDSLTSDDTLQKIIYGTTDIHMKFTKSPGDTTYATGPHQIEARIETLSGTQISAVSLNVETTYGGVTTKDTLPMTYNAIDHVWSVTVPRCRVKTNIAYNITLTDILGNPVKISRSYYIKSVMLLDEIVGAFYFSPQDTTLNMASGMGGSFIDESQPTSWSRSLYLHEDLADDDTLNSRIVGSYGVRAMFWSGNTYTIPHLKIYFKAVTDTEIALGYIDPVADGATLVYEGEMDIKDAWINGPGAPDQWNQVIFQTPFILPPKHNILVYVEDYSMTPNSSSGIFWLESQIIPRYNVVYGAPVGAGGNYTVGLLSAIFGLGTLKEVANNSVVLTSIISPLQEDVQFTSDIDVIVSLLNLGKDDLDSCYIDWTLNGQQQPRYVYRPSISLLEGFDDTVKIGSYRPIAGGTDQIVVWVSMPNGIIDQITYDDTLNTTIAGCQNPLQGNYLVGSNAPYYKTLSSALYAIEQCGMSGKVTLELETQTFEESAVVNFNMTAADTLEIRPLSGTVDDVVINPIGGSAFVLKGAIHNLILKGFTIDARRSGNHGIEITGACTNVVVRDCKIYAQLASSEATACAIYSPSGKLDNIFIENNLIDGGYAGVYLYGTGSSAMNTGIALENNIIQNHYYTGLYSYYSEFSNIAYNTILSCDSSEETEISTDWYWYGMSLRYTNGPVIGNKIHQRGTVITSPCGIFMYGYHYYSTQSLGLVANNEIMIKSTYSEWNGMRNSGIYMDGNVRGDFLHNSIYVKGTSGTPNGIYIYGSNYNFNLLSIRNNNIVMESSYPIYLEDPNYSTQIKFAYNNIYSPDYVAYVGAANIPDIPMWKLLIPNDTTSVSVNPSFIDTDQSLELTSYSDLLCIQDVQVQNNIKREQRTVRTTMGAYGTGLPDQHDLGISKFIDPVFSTCSPDNVSVRIELMNNGSVVHDFATNPVTLHLNVKSLSGVILPYDTTISIVSGKLDLFASNEYTFTNMLNVAVADDYYITAWITNPLDTLPLNDTIRKTYSTIKISLPVDENFSNGIPTEFHVRGNSSSLWTVVTEGLDADSVVKPVFGTSMLMFTGNRGSYTELVTGRLELQGISSPKLEFWYFHDTVYAEDYLDVNIVLDGENYVIALSLLKQSTTYGWKLYEVDLTPYSNGSCVNIVFESMSESGTNVSQYIDRIRIIAKQDIAITDIFASEYSACDLKNKELKVVLSNLTHLDLNYSMTPTDVILEITGMPYTFSKTLNRDILAGFTSDTIVMASGLNFIPGTYQLKAYLTAVLDETPLNDTIRTSIVINPDMSIRLHPESGETVNCIAGGLNLNPTVTIYNTGNMDLSDIELILQIDTGETIMSTYTTLKETCTATILANDSLTYVFANTYKVPRSATYYVRAIASLSCDSSMINSTVGLTECVDIHNLYIISLDNPPAGRMDIAGSMENIVVSVKNESDNKRFLNVGVTAIVENTDGEIISSRIGSIALIEPSATEMCTFTETYKVPSDSVYYIKVYLNNVDGYLEDDTLKIKRETNVGIKTLEAKDGFTLGQNIPNPATNTTRIDYSIPEAGEVIFHVHSISGQLLYSQAIESPSGTNSLDLNTSTFAAGVYYYSIEYKGQKRVKRMSVTK